ncbi:hypothetical protein [Krasilnikovia sp. MM14-A1004]|uniref:hypothetical protein n=1 Tax=Krasilnikovia sp. MM14-A1004 TaxID=3373541 RepID=UPI00399D2B08
MDGQRRYADDPEPPSWYPGPRSTSGSGEYGRSDGPDASAGYGRLGGTDGPGGYGSAGAADGPAGYSLPVGKDGPGGYGLTAAKDGPGGYGLRGDKDGPGGYGLTGDKDGPGGYGLANGNESPSGYGPGGKESPGGYGPPGGIDGPGGFGRPGPADESATLGGGFRLPEQRSTDDRYPASAAVDPVTSTGGHRGPVGEPAFESLPLPVRGPEFPAVGPTGGPAPADGPAAPAPNFGGTPAPGAADPTGVIPSLSATTGDRVYRTRRPVSALVVGLVTLVLMVPVVRLLAQATFADHLNAASVVSAVLLTLGLPLTGVGLFALAGGGRPENRDAWLRPPVVYLPVGLLLVFAAAIAA